MNHELSETAVAAALTTRWLGHMYQYLPQTYSTNDLLKEKLDHLSRPPLPEGAVVLADYQSQGRGRLNRRWAAPPRTSLLFSVFLRPRWLPWQQNWLTMLAGVAVAEVIEAKTGLTTGLKWPNDVMALHEGQWRKVSGLLLEGIWTAAPSQDVILGIGINVNIPPDQLPQTITPPISLLAAMGKPVPRLDLLLDLLRRLEDGYGRAQQGYSPQPTWRQRLITLGQPVQVTKIGSGQIIIGFAEDVDDWGQLLVRDKSGILHTILAGDVTLRG
ncbi:MAG: biotin--[acetyl-CoA-carboxylase] ligase [Chloroflexi bacterium]|nr:biotin--[acetyl-CoA-carboxylase] ligase [Chloroflexota bacterium]